MLAEDFHNFGMKRLLRNMDFPENGAARYSGAMRSLATTLARCPVFRVHLSTFILLSMMLEQTWLK